jgi:hypothetical protein
MKEKKSGFAELKMSGATWVSAFSCGDIVWAYPYACERSEKHLGVVVATAATDQELMFPFVPVYVFSQKKILEYQINSVEIVSKT